MCVCIETTLFTINSFISPLDTRQTGVASVRLTRVPGYLTHVYFEPPPSYQALYLLIHEPSPIPRKVIVRQSAHALPALPYPFLVPVLVAALVLPLSPGNAP